MTTLARILGGHLPGRCKHGRPRHHVCGPCVRAVHADATATRTAAGRRS